MKICGIYKIVNPNGCVYIGQSINITRRWNEYSRLQGCCHNARLLNSFKKYGFKNHKFEILHQCNPEQLNELEIYYIDLFQCFNTEKGLNLHSGGSNNIISDETRGKLRKSHLGQIAWNKGKPKTDEEKLAHSIKMKGRKPSEEVKQKRLTARKKANYHHSEETIKKLSESKKGNKAWLGKHHTEESKLKMRKPKLK